MLTKGFAVVEETGMIEGDWFPIVHFYDDRGIYLGYLLLESISLLYTAIRNVFLQSEDKRNDAYRVICDFTGDNETIYKIEIIIGFIYLYPDRPNIILTEEKIENSLVVIDSTSAEKLLQAIEELI